MAALPRLGRQVGRMIRRAFFTAILLATFASIALFWISVRYAVFVSATQKEVVAIFGGQMLICDDISQADWSRISIGTTAGSTPFRWRLPQWSFALGAYVIPTWLPVAVFIVPIVLRAGFSIRRMRARSSRSRRGECEECGYALRGNVSGRCPECGLRIST